jgi:flagellin
MTALQTLTQINKELGTTQSRISTGQKVSKASDNAAYWSIATTMRSDNSALSAVSEALGLGASKVDTAYSGMDAAIGVVEQIKDKLVTAKEPSADKAKIQADIAQLQDQLRGIAESASFSGENWLQADLSGGAQTQSVVSSFVRDSTGGVSVKTIDYTLDTTTVLYDTGGNTGILDKVYNVSQAATTLSVNVNGTISEYTVGAYSVDDLIAAGATFTGDYANDGTNDYVKVANDTWVKAVDVGTTGQEVVYDDGTTKWGVDTTATPATNIAAPASLDTVDVTGLTNTQIDAMISGVDAALSSMTDAASSLGSISSRIDLQTDFISKLMDSLDRGVGRLVDADMEKESARLSALQVQQQLGIQALSIANSNTQNILSLFRQ